MTRIKKNTLALLSIIGIVNALANTVLAREPGVGPAFPGGLTLGIPTGALPPPGVYVLQRFNYADGEVVDNKGHGTGTDVSAFVGSTQFNFSTNWKLFGGRYMTFLAFPYVFDQDVSGAPAGTGSSSGFLNPVWKHLLSWDLGGGWFTAVGFAPYIMIGDDDVAPQFDYILEPEAQVSYLGKDWHITGQVVFNFNGENDETKYRSGDQIFLNLSALKQAGKWQFGPVAYYQNQISRDKNNGPFYGGVAQDDAEALALGALVGYNFGPVMLRTYVTKNVHTRNTVDEFNAWLHAEFKLPL